MAINSKILNPVRFYEKNTEPDFVDRWPNPLNQLQRQKWIEGQKAVNWYKEYAINKALEWQLAIISGTSNDIDVYKYDSGTEQFEYDSTLSGSDISPQSFISETRLQFSYTFTKTGLYYFDMPGQGYRSDVVFVTDDEKYTRRMVEIEYTNSCNKFGMVFESDYVVEGNFSNIFTGKQYFTGILKAQTGTENSVFESDGGGLEKTRATVIDKVQLEVYEAHKTYVPHINRLFACDNLTVNGIRYNNEDVPEIEDIEGTDLVNFSVALRNYVTSNDY